ncbi:MAG TPA: enoyl-CoA hydratase/isomerase family protein [Gammaproteobacteria bacterium]|jgi:enoyl-CoA hydratase/carnithine racemase|nr:enoyl-CoA hydratase/isomerase family protein [Gammaproteobacteria bacterium]HIA96255.1 enoyl-CoA hydratase/isomerase family protein [Gammaproteobacteria bacterium]HIB74980.1 enoyl-CoA hydratase/isomerase family protein [Gammaproteobacteria bacterium]HIN73701.1 enoyl-CoA hydratase/isomerase family protein [Gammaproteobacteria bacterium]HIO04570.1 enoyl-CoA hydratase/isomerase family protein [Gammaproteobacteria bacterium]
MSAEIDLNVSLKNQVGVVEINRPPNNHFDYKLISYIADCFDNFDKDINCRCIVLCSDGKHFCAGANFGKDRDMQDKADPYSELYTQAVRLFKNKKPVIAAVQGGAIGGGLGLSLVADFRIGCPESRFSANFSRLGFHQGFGTTVTLPRVVGPQNAAMMMLTGRRLKGQEAFDVGLIDYLVPLNEVRSKAIELAEEISESGPLAVQSIRATIRAGLAEQVEEIVSWELSEQVRLQSTKDFKEGIKASLERRKPKFEGS